MHGSVRTFAALGAAAMMAAASPAFGRVTAQAVPVKYNLTARPGAPVTREVTVLNQGDVPVVVTVRYTDWNLDASGGLQLLPPGTVPNSLAGCIDLQPSSFSLQPGEAGQFLVTLTLPDDGIDTRWGLLLSEVRPAIVDPNAFGPRAVGELGTTLYLSRLRPDEIRPEVTAMRIEPLPGDSMQVEVEMRNAGGRHFYVSGDIAIQDSSGTTLAGGSLPTGVVLPGTTRSFVWASQAGLSPGDYIAAATLDTGQPELTIGERSFRWRGPGPVELPIATADP